MRSNCMCVLYVLTWQRLIDERSSGWKLSDDLIVVLVDVQPAATMEGVFFHWQRPEQSELQKKS